MSAAPASALPPPPAESRPPGRTARGIGREVGHATSVAARSPNRPDRRVTTCSTGSRTCSIPRPRERIVIVSDRASSTTTGITTRPTAHSAPAGAVAASARWAGDESACRQDGRHRDDHDGCRFTRPQTVRHQAVPQRPRPTALVANEAPAPALADPRGRGLPNATPLRIAPEGAPR